MKNFLIEVQNYCEKFSKKENFSHPIWKLEEEEQKKIFQKLKSFNWKLFEKILKVCKIFDLDKF